jgi:Dolichyl-phosphate-mannose-protein mannosyltransferase
MNLNATIDAPTNSLRDAAPGMPQANALRGAGEIERWLHDHLTKIAVAITAAAFVARIVAAGRTYLNPDEALHYLLVNEPSLLLAYKASLTNAHPPLIYLLLYICNLAGHSELMLRLPSILAGTAFCWFAFKWIRALFGEAASLIALIVAAFSPTLIALSAEVREYALLLCCMAAALYFLERAFEEKSVATMWLFSFCLYLAILSHYSAAFFCLAAGVYFLARIADSGCPRKIVNAWATGQLGALAIYLFLYMTHVAKIRHNLAVWATSFGDTFFQVSQESIFQFSRENTWNIFRYMFVQRYVAGVMLIAFIAGASFLFLQEFMSSSRNHRSRHMGIQLLVPFVAVWAAAIAGIYPYVGSRHTIVLAPFAIAGASFVLSAICRQKLWATVLVATLLVSVSSVYGKPSEPGILKANQSRELMASAVSYVRQSIPEGDLIIADQESALPLAYYYCGVENTFFMSWSGTNFGPFSCNRHLIVPLHFWYLRPEGLAAPFKDVVRSHQMKPGDRVWIFQAGWGGNLIADLPKQAPRFQCLIPRTFGQNITVVPLMVGPDLAPAPQTKCPD